MSKTWIVAKSEFKRRVTSKWFIILTLVAPVFLIAIMVIPSVLTVFAAQGTSQTIAVVDETERLGDRFREASTQNVSFVVADLPADSLSSAVLADEYDGYIVVPASVMEGEGEVTFYSGIEGGLASSGRISNAVQNVIREQRLTDAAVQEEVLALMRDETPVRRLKLTAEGAQADATPALSIIGLMVGMLIYMAMLIYGNLVMLSVIEEKSSRVVEVIVSAVRPFQLLMGKVLGIGAVGLVQMVVWGMLFMGISAFAGQILGLFIDPTDFNLPAEASQEAMLEAADIALPTIPFDLIVWFVLFFLGGYLLYSSLMAAVGSAVEQQQDAQTMQLPVMIPIIASILCLFYVLEQPETTTSLVLSMIPLFSPVLMVVRVAISDVPFWEVALSFLLLIGGFVSAVWMSSRIYRVGILMYGKKPSFGELIRWFRLS